MLYILIFCLVLFCCKTVTDGWPTVVQCIGSTATLIRAWSSSRSTWVSQL